MKQEVHDQRWNFLHFAVWPEFFIIGHDWGLLFKTSDSQGMRPVAPAPPRNLLEMQISRSIAQTYWIRNSEDGVQEPPAQQALQVILTHIQVWESPF